jgi:uncharacterized protein YecA (UPF0149 family)
LICRLVRLRLCNYDEAVSKHSDDAGHAKESWHNGRPSGARANAADAIERQYGVDKPDVIEDFLHERVLDGLSDDRDGECPCGSGKSYWACHGKRVEG